ncbi:prepilin-type N-terminal cleavage/methylation domain-containing protein [Coprobacillus sp. AM18-4LB-d2]|nr:prepilin-type N-terminal cleavage/methylation domain-containing protein [Coprobacillus sp. AM18-4LB-d2]
MIKKENGFTLIEMIFCISVILVILLLVIPDVTNEKVNVLNKINNKAFIFIVNDFFYNALPKCLFLLPIKRFIVISNIYIKYLLYLIRNGYLLNIAIFF